MWVDSSFLPPPDEDFNGAYSHRVLCYHEDYGIKFGKYCFLTKKWLVEGLFAENSNVKLWMDVTIPVKIFITPYDLTQVKNTAKVLIACSLAENKQLYVTCNGNYEVYQNGKLIFEGLSVVGARNTYNNII